MNTTTTLENLPDTAALEQALDLRRQIDALKTRLRSIFAPTKRRYAKRKYKTALRSPAQSSSWWTPAKRLAKARAMRKWHRENGGGN